MNLTGLPPYQKNAKRKHRSERETVTAYPEIDRLIAQAKAIGPERKYLDWLRTQPSALDGAFGYWEMALGQGLNDPAHRRDANNSGVSKKPPFEAIALTPAQHRQAHQHGDSVIGDKDWWIEQVKLHLTCYIESQGAKP